MSLSTKVGSLLIPGSTGNQSVTGVGFQPKVVLFWTDVLGSDQTSTGFYNSFGVGISSSERRSGGNISNNGISPSSNINFNQNTFCIFAGSATSADLVSMDSDGFTLNWTAVQSGIVVNYLALGGTDLSNYKLGTLSAKTTTGTDSITGLGFQPDCVLVFAGRFASEPINSTGNGNGLFGFASSPSNQGLIAWRNLNNSNPQQAFRRQSKSNLVATTTNFIQASLQSFDADGFTLNYSLSGGTTDKVYYLAMKGAQFKVAAFNQPTSNGNQTLTGAGFTPKAAIFLSANDIGSNDDGPQNNARVSMGIVTNTSQRASLWTGETHNVATTVCRRDLDRTKVIKLMTEGISTTVNAAADHVSFDSDGQTINWSTTDATQREFLVLWIGEALGTPPTAPSALSLDALSSRTVVVSWTDNSSDETSFRIERKTDIGGTYAEIGSTGKNVTTYNDHSVLPSVTYYYKVRARNGSGDSSYLTEQAITTPKLGETIAIMSANLQHGEKTDGTTDYATQVQAMLGADIVCVQERSTSDTGWNSSMTTAGFSQAVFKAHLGSAGDGNAIWIRDNVNLISSYNFDMVNGINPTSGSAITGWDGVDVRRSVCAAKVQVGDRKFYIVSLHLVAASGEDNNSTNFASQRVDQINSLLGWIDSTLTDNIPIIIAGDFNLPPNYPRAPERSFTADFTTNVLTSNGHGFVDGTAVALRNSGGALPENLSAGDSLYAQAPVYYVIDSTSNTFKLSETWFGPEIDLSSNGTGSHFVAATQWDLFHSKYLDMWKEGLSSGKSTASWGDRNGDAQSDMPVHFQLTRTHDTRRIDYVMLKRGSSGLTLREITLPDNRTVCPHDLVSGGSYPACTPEVTVLFDTPDDFGVRPSDHNWTLSVFDTVRLGPSKFFRGNDYLFFDDEDINRYEFWPANNSDVTAPFLTFTFGGR